MDVFNKAVEKIKENDYVGLQQVIKTHSLAIETEDENGMTLLQHACFKGKKDVTQLLLDLVYKLLLLILFKMINLKTEFLFILYSY